MSIRPHPKTPARKGLTKAAKKKLRPGSFCQGAARCYKPQQHLGMCREHADQHLCQLMRQILVRDEGVTCVAAAWHAFLWPCEGPVQVNHLLDRDHMLTKFLLDNAIPGCSKLNKWAHYNKARWYRMVRDWKGEAYFKRLEDIAWSGQKLDWDQAHADLSVALGDDCQHLAAGLKCAA